MTLSECRRKVDMAIAQQMPQNRLHTAQESGGFFMSKRSAYERARRLGVFIVSAEIDRE